MKVYLIISISLLYLLGVLFSPIALAQLSPQKTDAKISNLFLPVPDLIYGPNGTQVTDLMYRYVEIYDSQDNVKLVIHNPDIFVDRINISNIPKGKNLQVILDSFFFLNRQEPQVIPEVSSITMKLSRILNPLEAADITQMNLSESVMLPSVMNDSGQRSIFAIPADIDSGDYLVDVSLFFPDSQVEATYSTRIIVEEANTTNEASINQ